MTGKRFKAQIYVDGKKQYLGTYATAKEAALAYDRAVVVQHKLPSSKLNCPNDYTSSSDDEKSVEESDGCSGGGSSNDSCHSSDSCRSNDDDDEESDDEPEPVPSPQARPCFERDPMLDRLFAEQQKQNRKG